jgi:hypothetical protein
MVVVHKAAGDEVEIDSCLFNGGEWVGHLLNFLSAFSFEGLMCFDGTWVEDGHGLNFHSTECLDEIVFYIIWSR